MARLRLAGCVVVFLGIGTVGAETPPIIEGRTIRIMDGDTIRVLHSLGQVKVDLAYVDAPERRQSFGDAARRALDDLVAGKRLLVVPVGESDIGVIQAEVYEGDVFVNKALIAQGYAWVRPEDRATLEGNGAEDEAHIASLRAELEQAQREAKSARRGIWRFPGAQPPWEWRASQGEQRE